MDVEKRLLRDAESFTNEITLLDEEGALARTLTVLGLTDSPNSEIEQNTSRAGRTQRPAPAGGPDYSDNP
ncbi:hypothetical protein SAMN05443665_101718 [Actinomadura meyerae]|uniref:Uncharacterized protein n=1 Tax=Actinomadura meyerae TaxID=240840 RepID=A0A239K7G9_9ACTN|nr:hypothetical protein [Actinomadura meyerae]SNT13698.1 hypothetical protein SAMN05443665_101718 [Actinomadura meyerae]